MNSHKCIVIISRYILFQLKLFYVIISYVPSELMTAAQGKEVAVNLVDKRTEDYLKPKQKLKAFSGQGHMLGRYVACKFMYIYF